MSENQKVINSVNGNVLSCLMAQEIDDEDKAGLRALHSKIQCLECGQPEVITYFPRYRSNLTDGYCNECIERDKSAK